MSVRDECPLNRTTPAHRAMRASRYLRTALALGRTRALTRIDPESGALLRESSRVVALRRGTRRSSISGVSLATRVAPAFRALRDAGLSRAELGGASKAGPDPDQQDHDAGLGDIAAGTGGFRIAGFRQRRWSLLPVVRGGHLIEPVAGARSHRRSRHRDLSPRVRERVNASTLDRAAT
jgi:hypothetical protein